MVDYDGYSRDEEASPEVMRAAYRCWVQRQAARRREVWANVVLVVIVGTVLGLLAVFCG